MIKVTIEDLSGEFETKVLDGEAVIMSVKTEDGEAIMVEGRHDATKIIKQAARLSSEIIRAFFKTDKNKAVRRLLTNMFENMFETLMDGDDGAEKTVEAEIIREVGPEE